MINDRPTPIGVHSHRPDEYVPDGTTFKLEDVKIGARWRHYKNGTEYTILSISRWSTNGPEEGKAVIEYQSDNSDHPCTRFADQFLDGRFRPVSEDERMQNLLNSIGDGVKEFSAQDRKFLIKRFNELLAREQHLQRWLTHANTETK